MVSPERLKPTAPLSQVKLSITGDSTGIIQLFDHCITDANGDRNQVSAWLDSDPKAD